MRSFAKADISAARGAQADIFMDLQQTQFSANSVTMFWSALPLLRLLCLTTFCSCSSPFAGRQIIRTAPEDRDMGALAAAAETIAEEWTRIDEEILAHRPYLGPQPSAWPFCLAFGPPRV